jgi:hypothetical protein
VESSVGSEEFESFMINGIAVQPSTTASQPSSFIRPMTRAACPAGDVQRMSAGRGAEVLVFDLPG